MPNSSIFTGESEISEEGGVHLEHLPGSPRPNFIPWSQHHARQTGQPRPIAKPLVQPSDSASNRDSQSQCYTAGSGAAGSHNYYGRSPVPGHTPKPASAGSSSGRESADPASHFINRLQDNIRTLEQNVWHDKAIPPQFQSRFVGEIKQIRRGMGAICKAYKDEVLKLRANIDTGMKEMQSIIAEKEAILVSKIEKQEQAEKLQEQVKKLQEDLAKANTVRNTLINSESPAEPPFLKPCSGRNTPYGQTPASFQSPYHQRHFAGSPFHTPNHSQGYGGPGNQMVRHGPSPGGYGGPMGGHNTPSGFQGGVGPGGGNNKNRFSSPHQGSQNQGQRNFARPRNQPVDAFGFPLNPAPRGPQSPHRANQGPNTARVVPKNSMALVRTRQMVRIPTARQQGPSSYYQSSQGGDESEDSARGPVPSMSSTKSAFNLNKHTTLYQQPSLTQLKGLVSQLKPSDKQLSTYDTVVTQITEVFNLVKGWVNKYCSQPIPEHQCNLSVTTPESWSFLCKILCPDNEQEANRLAKQVISDYYTRRYAMARMILEYIIRNIWVPSCVWLRFDGDADAEFLGLVKRHTYLENVGERDKDQIYGPDQAALIKQRQDILNEIARLIRSILANPQYKHYRHQRHQRQFESLRDLMFPLMDKEVDNSGAIEDMWHLVITAFSTFINMSVSGVTYLPWFPPQQQTFSAATMAASNSMMNNEVLEGKGMGLTFAVTPAIQVRDERAGCVVSDCILKAEVIVAMKGMPGYAGNLDQDSGSEGEVEGGWSA
ncbi:hypothetical protein MKZ38_008248 [Zalerion maritima]|uniref:Uncharacterized protein n=1 Tax=Zalerion maritima TaxID=339359 RepID=A0AAD5RUC4_9PEZI|nr:hypothetical protein MKZ38_008248 [Zalerion maritima]